MSSSKFGLGGSPLLSPSTPQSSLDQTLSSSSTVGRTSPLGSNLLTPGPLAHSLSPNPSSSSANPLQVSDLLPTQSAGNPLILTEEVQDQQSEEPLRGVHLSSVGRNKVQVVKAIRSHWGTGLKEAKTLADSAPLDLPLLPESEALAAETELSALGAVIGHASESC